MRAKINAAIIKDEDGHLLVKVFNGYGDPEIQFVSDAIRFEGEPTFQSMDDRNRGMQNAYPYNQYKPAPEKVKAPLAFRFARAAIRLLATAGYAIAYPIDAFFSTDYADFLVRRRFGWSAIWRKEIGFE
jgi:hypothetical protein